MKKILILLTSLLISNVYAQQQPSNNNTNLANIIPPSPTAYALGNYGNVPVGLFTGTVNFSVPLLTYKTNNINLPLNMFYGSNGIKLDEVSSNVGLGWSLNFGGVISRTVRDKPDDTSQKLQIPSNTFEPNNTPAYWNFIYNVGNISGGIDTEADIYSFNFNGVSGKFFYDRDDQVHLIEQQALKIEKSTTGFIITLPNGEKYYFDEKEITNFKTLGVGHQLPNIGTTAWYLTKIVHPKGDEVYFTYENIYLNYTSSQSQTFTLAMPYTTCQNTTIANPSGNTSVVVENLMTVNGKRIKTITSNNMENGSINFNYTTNTINLDEGGDKIQNITQTDKNGNILETVTFNYLNTANKRNFLTGIVFKDPKKSYAFDYEKPSDLEVRLSYKRDQWGYYNGKANGTLIPVVTDYNLNTYFTGANQAPDPNFAKIGMLKKITYPTKGYTELEYEGNTYWGTKTINPDYSYINMTAANSAAAGTVTQPYPFTSPIDQPVEISGYSVFNGNCGEQTHTPIGRVTVTDPAGNTLLNSQFISGGQINTVSFSAAAGVNYTIKLSASRCTYIDVDTKYYPSAPQVFDTNLDTGGVRIKSTKDYDAPSSVPKYTRYYYGPKEDINHSSGDKGANPFFVYTFNSGETCSLDGGPLCNFIQRSFVVLTSNSVLPLFDTDKSTSAFYKYVTISHGGDNFERGGETKEYQISRDFAGTHLWGTNDIKGTPYTNHGWNNGQELSSQVLRKNTNGTIEVIQSKVNNYIKSDANTFELKNFTHRRNDLIECQRTTPYLCTQYDITKPGHACNGKAVGDIIDMPYIENLDVDEYRTVSYWTYLKSQNTTDYLNGTPVSTQTEYFYDNPLNYQLSRQKVTLPDLSVNETSYQYAHEKGNQLMIGKNMVGIPLETLSTQTIGSTTKTLSRTETVYPTAVPTPEAGNFVLPLSVKSYDIPNNITKTEVKYDKYDASNGNVLQYTVKTGTPVAIVWGYHNTQPIAKVEGITYDQLVALGLISSIVTPSDGNDEAALVTALDSFRNNTALSNFKITTLTYKPSIGVKSLTPPSGIREVYIYDSFNRLKEVRENDDTGNILKEFNYNYKP